MLSCGLDSRVDPLLCVFALPCSDVHTHGTDVSVSSTGTTCHRGRTPSAAPACEAPAALGEMYVGCCSCDWRLTVCAPANYDPAMRVVAFTELLIFLRVAFGAILLRNSLVAPLIYAHFLRQRYYQSAFTREAVSYADERVLATLGNPAAPPVVGTVWGKVREFAIKWAGSGVIEQNRRE